MILGAERYAKVDWNAPPKALRCTGYAVRPDGLYHAYCCDEYTYRWHLDTIIPTPINEVYFRIGVDQEPPAGKYTFFIRNARNVNEKTIFHNVKGANVFPSMRLVGSERKDGGIEMTVVLMQEDLERARELEFALTIPGSFPCTLKKWVRPKTTTTNPSNPSGSGDTSVSQATADLIKRARDNTNMKKTQTKNPTATATPRPTTSTPTPTGLVDRTEQDQTRPDPTASLQEEEDLMSFNEDLEGSVGTVEEADLLGLGDSIRLDDNTHQMTGP